MTLAPLNVEVVWYEGSLEQVSRSSEGGEPQLSRPRSRDRLLAYSHQNPGLLAAVPAQPGELRIGCLRSKNSGSPMLRLFISSIWACNSGGSSLRSPSRASASEVKYMTIV